MRVYLQLLQSMQLKQLEQFWQLSLFSTLLHDMQLLQLVQLEQFWQPVQRTQLLQFVLPSLPVPVVLGAMLLR